MCASPGQLFTCAPCCAWCDVASCRIKMCDALAPSSVACRTNNTTPIIWAALLLRVYCVVFMTVLTKYGVGQRWPWDLQLRRMCLPVWWWWRLPQDAGGGGGTVLFVGGALSVWWHLIWISFSVWFRSLFQCYRLSGEKQLSGSAQLSGLGCAWSGRFEHYCLYLASMSKR
jgi:hypothetical protein